MWRDMKLNPPSRDSADFIALGNEEVALVWWEPEGPMQWKIMNLPGRGVRLGDRLALTFHSWCPVHELHLAMNKKRNPEYYMTEAEILARRQG